MGAADIGLIGLGTMGANLALNMADKGYGVAVHNRTVSRIFEFIGEAGDLADRLVAAETAEALVRALPAPRAIVIMVKAGGPVDAVIAELADLLEPGDILIDAGNADFNDTRRREASLAEKGLRFVGMGVSGGSHGARHGPSIMVGGSEAAWDAISGIVEAIAARYDGQPCAAHLGPDGAGHFVKTVHNGIEYADMQLIAEVYGALGAMGQEPTDMAALFEHWNSGPLQSYLIEISAKVLQATDPETGRPMVEVIEDRAGQKGTGRWTLIEALKLGQSASTIEAAVAARSWSAEKDLRLAGAEVLSPEGTQDSVDLSEDDLHAALLAARIVAYAQGFRLMAAASAEFDWSLDLARVAEIWRAGCIIRSALLDDIATAFRADAPGSLILAPRFADTLAETVPALRRVVAGMALGGLPVPAFSAALAWYDSQRQARGTANLIQAQRDFFGAHGFERVDRDGTGFHGPWG